MYRKPIIASLFALLLLATSACDDSPAAPGGGADADDATVNTDAFVPIDGEDETEGDAAEEDAAEDDAEADAEDDVVDEPGEFLSRFDECGFGGPPCEPPLQCMGTCQLLCDDGECPEGEDCIDLSGVGAAGICGWYVGVGDDCSFEQALFCEEGLFCNDDGECEAPTVAGEGDPCGGEALECDEGLICVSVGFGEGFCHVACDNPTDCDTDEVCLRAGFSGDACFEDCDPPADTECTNDTYYECRTQMGSSDAACLPRTSGPVGDQEFGEACDNENRCQEDLICTPMIPGAFCTQECNTGTPCPTDPPGADCIDLFIANYCGWECPNGNSDCPEGMTCTNVYVTAICTW